MSTSDRGFGSMDINTRREIARKGGRASHEKGTAHRWTPDEASKAGRKGGLERARRAAAATAAAPAGSGDERP
jgi:general stress protein YciG